MTRHAFPPWLTVRRSGSFSVAHRAGRRSRVIARGITHEADAKLCAASPHLLGSLRWLLDLHHNPAVRGDDPEWRLALDAAHAALTEAGDT